MTRVGVHGLGNGLALSPWEITLMESVEGSNVPLRGTHLTAEAVRVGGIDCLPLPGVGKAFWDPVATLVQRSCLTPLIDEFSRKC